MSFDIQFWNKIISRFDKTALCLAIEKEELEIVKILLSHEKIDINIHYFLKVVYVCAYWWSNNFSRSPNTRNQAQNLILKINEKLIHRV